MPLNESELKTLLEVAEKATPGPYFTAPDAAHDAPDHENSGLAMIDTGRADDWPIARLCEWNAARFIAAFDPTTCAKLVRRLIATNAEVERLREQLKETQKAAEKWYHERY